jgi:hypothetical protein
VRYVRSPGPDARDGVWTLCSLAVYDMLVELRGWSADRYETCLAERLTDLLLPRWTRP